MTDQRDTRELVWDDVLWERVWERTLDPVERHDIAVATWRRRTPSDPLAARVAPELTRRWRRHSLSLATLYALWTLFWGAIAWDDWSRDGVIGIPLAVSAAGLGLAAVTCCVIARQHLRTPFR